jgi:7-cyano-7-deazaguanine synthase
MTFAYHGIAKMEVVAAKAIADRAGVAEHRFVRLPDLREAEDIPGVDFGRLPPIYIPMRNAIFYSFAASYAEEVSATAIVGGHNADDEKVFADVSSGFFGSLQRAFLAGSPILRKRGIRIVRPLGKMHKAEVVKLAESKGVPLELTWSCHQDGNEHCWECEGCKSRIAAFMEAGVRDPLRIQRGKNYLRGRKSVLPTWRALAKRQRMF